MNAAFDALVVCDPRFAGGSTAAVAADVAAMSALGLRVGLQFVRSRYLEDSRDRLNPKALALADLPGVTRLDPSDRPRAALAFLHHPMVFFCGIEERLTLAAERAVVVTHHPAFRSDGSLEWDPLATLWRVRRQTGLAAWYAPISGVVRAQLASFSPLLRQTSADWPNVFEPGDWPIERPILSGDGLTIGRHGRADGLKFPATGAEIDAALPAGPGLRVRVLGCPVAELARRGAHPDRWEVLPFGAEPVHRFLNSLDVFVYHYHPTWCEAFGRTVVEAALCGRPCLLDPRLEATFGNMATYCRPMETAAALARLVCDPKAARRQADRARETAVARFGTASLAQRLSSLRNDAGVAQRESTSAGPAKVLRKIAGLYRRRRAGASA